MRPIVITEEYLTQFREQAAASIAEQLDKTFSTLASQRNSISIPSIKFEQKLDTERKLETPIQLNFSGIAYAKQLSLIQNCASEIAWHGTVTTNEERTQFTIENIQVYPQTVTSTTVVTDEAKYQQWKQLLNDDDYNSLRFQAHSHVNMATAPSGVDRNLYENVLQSLSNDSFYIFMIANKKMEVYVEIYDLKNNAYYSNNDISITVEGIRLKNWYDAQYEAHITKPVVPTYVTPTYSSYPSQHTQHHKDLRTDWQRFMDGDGPNPYAGRSTIRDIAEEVDDLTGAYPRALASDTAKRGRGRPPKDENKKGGKK